MLSRVVLQKLCSGGCGTMVKKKKYWNRSHECNTCERTRLQKHKNKGKQEEQHQCSITAAISSKSSSATHSHLTHFQRSSIATLHSVGMDEEHISHIVNTDKRTAHKWIERAHESLEMKDLERSGRPNVLTEEEKTLIVATTKLQPTHSTPPQIKRRLDLDCSHRTIRRVLDNANLHSRVIRKKHILTEVEKKKRLSFAEGYKHWTKKDWERILFADEKNFHSNYYMSRFTQREPNTALDDLHILPYLTHPPLVHVWACFSHSGLGTLYSFEETLNGQYMTSIFDCCLKESANKLFPHYGQWYFIQDNSRIHTDKRVTAWLHNHGISCIQMPTYSPDLNPIEHLWPHIEARVEMHNTTNKDDLHKAVHEEWKKTDERFFKHLIHSMPRRLNAVIEAHGGYTTY